MKDGMNRSELLAWVGVLALAGVALAAAIALAYIRHVGAGL